MSEQQDDSIEVRLDETIDRLEAFLAAFIEQAEQQQTMDGDDGDA